MSDASPDIFTEKPEAGADASAELTELLADIASTIPAARAAINASTDMKALEEVRVEFLGKKGKLADFNSRMGALSKEEKPVAGKILNARKGEIVTLLKTRQDELESRELDDRIRREAVDITLPGLRGPRGNRHPVALVQQQVVDIFASMGFRLESGPEIETEWLNFDALNMTDDHPARDMQDTFYTERNHVLRTHTSPTQIRSMLRLGAPLAVVTTGRVYRHDSDATHSPMFHQMEGLFVDEGVSVGHLKHVLLTFLRAFYGEDVKVRLRPSFFPFTEPSLEADIWNEQRKGWMEVLGSGMVHPTVLRNGGIDPEKYTGFAFGVGLDRLAMVKYGIPDLRLLFENDVRFLKQFG
jgi:phenylalanyl-tRNA synthetase alpha chain